MEITWDLIMWIYDIMMFITFVGLAIALIKSVYDYEVEKLENELVDEVESVIVEAYEVGRDLGRARHLK